MTLSQAIRKGLEQRPQGFGALFSTAGGMIRGSCALGAAYEGLMGTPDAEPAGKYERLLRHFPILTLEAFSCPAAAGCLPAFGLPTSVVAGVVAHLNDQHRWTREQIATWLEGEEARARHDRR